MTPLHRAEDLLHRQVLRRRSALRQSGCSSSATAARSSRRTTAAGPGSSARAARTNALYRSRFVDEKNGLDRRAGGHDPAHRRRRQDLGRSRTAAPRSTCSASTRSRPSTWSRSATRRPSSRPRTAGRPGNRQHKPDGRDPHREEKILLQDPVFYDVQFVDAQNGLIVGEFGKIMHTTDGGETWTGAAEVARRRRDLDLLDLPTFFGIHFLDATERHRGRARAATSRARATAANRGPSTTWRRPRVDPLFTGQSSRTAPAGPSAPPATSSARGHGRAWERPRSAGGHRGSAASASSTRSNGWIVGGFGTDPATRATAARPGACGRMRSGGTPVSELRPGPRANEPRDEKPLYWLGGKLIDYRLPGHDRRHPRHRVLRLLRLPAHEPAS